MAESFPTTLGTQLAKVREGEAELHRTKLAAMDAVAEDVAARADGCERGGYGSIEEFVFAIHGLNPHHREGAKAKDFYHSITEQFGQASWGRVFALGTVAATVSKQLWLHAIDGSDERAWLERGVAEPPYSALRYQIERWDAGSNTTFIGKVIVPNVFSTDYSLSEADAVPQVKKHDLLLKTFTRQSGGVAALFDTSSVIKPIPKIEWGLDIVEGLHSQNAAQTADAASAIAFAEMRIYRHPDFNATPRMLDD